MRKFSNPPFCHLISLIGLSFKIEIKIHPFPGESPDYGMKFSDDMLCKERLHGRGR